MARNYTFAEAVAIINEGKDMESIVDMGRRYPVLLHKVTKVCAAAGQDFVDLMNYIPPFITANKVNTLIKNEIAGTGEEPAGEDDAEPNEIEKKPAAKKAAKSEEEPADEYDSWTVGQIWQEMKKRGLDKTVKSTKKGDRIAALREYDKNGGITEEAEAEDEAEETAGAYDGKSAMELFKECKKRGIKAEPKKPAKFYADLLTKDDAKKSKTEEAEDDEDWGEDEAEVEKPAAKKAEKPAKKPAKKDDDDDWDI